MNNNQILYFYKCKDIQRFNGAYTHRTYNLMEHQWNVGMLFRYFASIEDVPYDINVWDIVLKHDMGEVATSCDLPWTIKNFNQKTKEAWSVIENEMLKHHYFLEKYSDENIKNSLTELQFALFKACDTLDLFIFCKNEISLGNKSVDMLKAIENCLLIFDSLKFQFPSINNFVNSYDPSKSFFLR